MNRTRSNLQVLDETCALGQVSTNTSNALVSDAAPADGEGEQPGRLRKASVALQSALGLKKTKTNEGQGPGTTRTEPESFQDSQGRQFNDNMVDVLDTLGM